MDCLEGWEMPCRWALNHGKKHTKSEYFFFVHSIINFYKGRISMIDSGLTMKRDGAANGKMVLRPSKVAV